jgi:hypothetical protein
MKRDGMKRDPKETGGMPGCRTYLGDSQLYIHGIGHMPGARAQGGTWNPTTVYLLLLILFFSFIFL